jgi:hypothetical protein
MDGSTKILTVSYGTFSCTLEGFDDPLGAMRDIAEYFRDLAADDRYFGAEPPTPDVDMLQNIAEKEVNRRVEARMSDAGVSLRQVAHDADPVEDADEAADGAADGVDVSPEETAAAKDAKIVEASAMAARVVSAVRAEEPRADAKDNADTPETGSGPLTFDDDFLMADEPEDVLALDPAAHLNNDGPAESVAEKLRRIRAVVSRNLDAEPGQSDSAKPDAATQDRDRALTETIEQITADLAEDEDAPDMGAETTGDLEAKTDVSKPDASGDTSEPTGLAGRDTSEALWGADEEDDVSKDDVLADEPVAHAANASDQDDESEKKISELIESVTERVEEGADVDEPQDLQVDAAASKDDSGRDAVTRLLNENQDNDVGRLLAETDTKLNEDDVVRRRRVISQMRAAVAATKADRLVSRQPSREVVEEEEQSPYRDDLSEAVRTATAMPKGNSQSQTAAAPLVLVSSQRVDDETPEDTAPAADMPENFADFAKDMGAKELPELLEAAAAYTVFSEGHSSFTRPEIMKRVAAVDPTIRMSREESLRSFGQLLRQGKFRKLERGQFTIDQDTKFNPKHRIAGE